MEPPVDVDARTEQFAASVDGTILVVADGDIVGSVHVDARRFGVGELGMVVGQPWRGRGVGSALLTATIEKARAEGLHKLSSEVFPHNEAAIALYRKFGFVEEGRRVSTIAARAVSFGTRSSWDSSSRPERTAPG